MAELRFYFGTMGSGKSTMALQIHHNLTSRGLSVILTTQLDRAEGQVSSRLGVAADAVVVTPDTNLFVLAEARDRETQLDAMVCDEAQFYEPRQIEQLAKVVDLLGVDVYAFGLLTSFQGVLFPGSQRLLELADSRHELQVETRCWCGRRATHNARLMDGHQVYEGQLKVVGDTPDRSNAVTTYELRCRYHWHQTKWANDTEQLTLDVRPIAHAGGDVSEPPAASDADGSSENAADTSASVPTDESDEAKIELDEAGGSTDVFSADFVVNAANEAERVTSDGPVR